jgi:hypothetical protein
MPAKSISISIEGRFLECVEELAYSGGTQLTPIARLGTLGHLETKNAWPRRLAALVVAASDEPACCLR